MIQRRTCVSAQVRRLVYCAGGLLSLPANFVGLEADDVLPDPVIQLLHTCLNRFYLIRCINLCRFPDRSKAPCVLRNDPHQLRRNAQAGQYIVTGLVFDRIEFILGRDLTDRDGDVLAVKTEEVEVNGQKKLALFAQVEPTPDLIAMNKARQKIYTSIEIDDSFSDTGEAYIVGLAVTDSPASLGTDVLAFSAQKPDSSPFKDRHY